MSLTYTRASASIDLLKRLSLGNNARRNTNIKCDGFPTVSTLIEGARPFYVTQSTPQSTTSGGNWAVDNAITSDAITTEVPPPIAGIPIVKQTCVATGQVHVGRYHSAPTNVNKGVVSGFFKRGADNDYATLAIYRGATAGDYRIAFHMVNKTFHVITGTFGNMGYIDLDDGWVWVWAEVAADATSTSNYVKAGQSSTVGATGVPSGYIYIACVQYEDDVSYPSTPLQTTGSILTRAEDAAYYTFGSGFPATFTIVVPYFGLFSRNQGGIKPAAANYNAYVRSADNGYDGLICHASTSNNKLAFQIQNGAGTEGYRLVSTADVTVSDSVVNTVAIAHDALGDMRMYVNGAKQITDIIRTSDSAVVGATDGTIKAFNQLSIGYQANDANRAAFIYAKPLLFTRQLSDAEHLTLHNSFTL